jgi:hypothetical protein
MGSFTKSTAVCVVLHPDQQSVQYNAEVISNLFLSGIYSRVGAWQRWKA